MSGIHILRLGGGGGLKYHDEPVRISDIDSAGLPIRTMRATVTLNTDGTLVGRGLFTNRRVEDFWYFPEQDNIGNGYWVKATKIGGNATCEGLSLGVVYALTASRAWFIDNDFGSGPVQGYEEILLRFDFYRNSGGTGTPVGSMQVELSREWAV